MWISRISFCSVCQTVKGLVEHILYYIPVIMTRLSDEVKYSEHNIFVYENWEFYSYFDIIIYDHGDTYSTIIDNYTHSKIYIYIC